MKRIFSVAVGVAAAISIGVPSVLALTDNSSSPGRTVPAVTPSDVQPADFVAPSAAAGEPEPGDDRGRGVEPGDDHGMMSGAGNRPGSAAADLGQHHGRAHAEAGDDHGRAAEPGDDHGRAAEPGDDHRRAAEPGDDHRGRDTGRHGGSGTGRHGDRGGDDGSVHR